MNIVKIIRRFLIPSPIITGIYLFKFGCKISTKAEVELTSNLKIGKGTQISSFSKIKASDGPLIIGSKVSIGSCCFVASGKGGVVIGDHSMIGHGSSIVSVNYRYDSLDMPISMQELTSKGVSIGRNVWMGSGCVILDGSNIGEGVIVTPNSVVSGKIPDNSIVQGNPARVVFVRR